MSGNYLRKDYLYQQAKTDGYRSRAAYKLLELNKKFAFLKRGASILDLGCFPGGWLQVAMQKTSPSGVVVGADIKEVEAVEFHGGSAVIYQADVFSGDFLGKLHTHFPSGVDVVLSDMSPQLSGIAFRDALLSAELVERSFELARETLRDNGTVVAKIFPGQEAEDVVKKARMTFKKVTREHLSSTRRTSNEFYIVAQGIKDRGSR